MDNYKTIGSLLIGISIILIFILSFVKINVDNQAAFLCDAVHANPELEMQECPVHKSNTSWLLTTAFGISFLTSGIGIFMVFMPVKKESKLEFKEIDATKLDEEEKKIYTLLKENQGSMYQSDLIKETGLSKVKITRILDKMTLKNVLDRKRRGMTNIIFLK